MTHPKHNSGFSLVELSIVLVILGLLTGGILGGQALIKAAELRSVTTEFNTWLTAVNTFKGKYFQLPGDMNNATQFWGRADNGTFSGQCADPDDDEGTGTQTCNGDGNGSVVTDSEELRFWQHLANAGLINGEFTGVGGSGGVSHAVAGENIPRAKYNNGAWGTDNEGDSAGNTQEFAYNYGHVFVLGAPDAAGEADSDLFNPEDLWNVDTKMDDGKPGRGKVMVHDWNDCTDASSATDNDADYLLDDEEIDCIAYFTQAY